MNQEEIQAPGISVKGLSFYYQSTQVLKNISIDFADKCVTAIIGPSGCGKSTLLRIFNRMYDLYPGQRAEGSVIVNGENIIDPSVPVTSLRAKIGMIFQSPTPFPMSIYENIAFPVRLYRKLSRSEMNELVETSLRKAALWDEVKDKLRRSGLSLSGGQQQRLCIARAIATRPDILLMDEPASALDPISTAQIDKLIYELKEDFCVVLVTHNLPQAARVSDFTAFLFLGDLIEFGPTEKIFTAPQSKQTEDYVTGRMG